MKPQPLPKWISAVGHGRDAAKQGSDTRGNSLVPGQPQFVAGAAIFALDQIIRSNPVWIGCWRMRMALKAAVSIAGRLRLGADASRLRDALHLTRAGDDPGPAGRLHLMLRRWVAWPSLPAAESETEIMREVAGNPTALEVAALLGADRALATMLGWASPLPLHVAAIDDSTWSRRPDGRRLRVDAAGLAEIGPVLLLRSALAAHAEAVMLARRAEAAIMAAAALRTRDEGRGLAQILADDSVAPWRMAGKAQGRTGMNSDRAARRFCESLHGRGALKLLTDRPAFRVYGL